RLTPQSRAHGQRLVCSAANEAGPAPAEAALTLDVLFPPDPPTIEGLESPQVRAGDTLRLVCVARGGNPPPSLHWDKVLGALGGTGSAGKWPWEGLGGTGSTGKWPWEHWEGLGGTGRDWERWKWPWEHWEGL
ncbi:NPHN protein, partial [Lophotis ruficrista]|nr:NPHN protein [Lophotis ruficrista]